jgi:hypothetical protein
LAEERLSRDSLPAVDLIVTTSGASLSASVGPAAVEGGVVADVDVAAGESSPLQPGSASARARPQAAAVNRHIE